MNTRSLTPLWPLTVLLFIVFNSLSTSDVNAQSLNLKKLLMPDALSASHAHLEADCGNCHVGFKKEAQSALCLDCHEKIQSDLKNNSGYHSSLTTQEKSECQQCHTDHRGRTSSLTTLSASAFDHDKSDFPLIGKHIALNCAACHKPSEDGKIKMKRDTEQNCVSCHREDDRHETQLGESCQDCHTAKNWQDTTFDHDTTEFTLLGKHKNTRCAACHADQYFKNTPSTCYSCHLLDDIHKGKQGTQCNDCHQETDWAEMDFDHNTQTDFKLLGTHATAACAGCHKDSQFEAIKKTQCVDCHRNDDIHLNQRGSECKNCHNEKRWGDSTFSHDRDTDFSLKGQHQSLHCESCHSTNPYQDTLNNTCIACHQSNDIHKGKQGKNCARCHSESSWIEDVVFDHDLTNFPLIGLHAVTACEQCHVTKPFQAIENQCVDCHSTQDIHKKSLGSACHNCHTPNGWDIWRFDHNTETHFPLDGAHADLECSACHNTPTNDRVKAISQCVNCHKNDDKHDGEFGRRCDKCHQTNRFDQLKPF